MTSAILLINSLGTGGAERAVIAAAAELLAGGRKVEIVCLERHDASLTLPAGIPVCFLSNLSASSSPLVKLLALPFLALRLAARVSRQETRSVMSHLFRANFVNVLARLLTRSRHKAVLVNHTRISRLRHEGLQGMVNWTLCRLLYPRADLVASVSTGASAECGRLLRLPPDKVITLYDPIRLALPGATERGDSPTTIVAVGRLVALKRFEDLLDAFCGLTAEVPGLRLKMIGDGPERALLEKRAASSPVSDRIHFLGQVADPAAELAVSDVFVSTSAVEGFGMAIVEALAAGLPVISADCAYGPREILAPHSDSSRLLPAGSDLEIAEFGLLYPVGNVKALQKALKLVLEDDALRKDLGRKGPSRAVDFSVEKSTAAYERILFA